MVCISYSGVEFPPNGPDLTVSQEKNLVGQCELFDLWRCPCLTRVDSWASSRLRGFAAIRRLAL